MSFSHQYPKITITSAEAVSALVEDSHLAPIMETACEHISTVHFLTVHHNRNSSPMDWDSWEPSEHINSITIYVAGESVNPGSYVFMRFLTCICTYGDGQHETLSVPLPELDECPFMTHLKVSNDSQAISEWQLSIPTSATTKHINLIGSTSFGHELAYETYSHPVLNNWIPPQPNFTMPFSIDWSPIITALGGNSEEHDVDLTLPAIIDDSEEDPHPPSPHHIIDDSDEDTQPPYQIVDDSDEDPTEAPFEFDSIDHWWRHMPITT